VDTVTSTADIRPSPVHEGLLSYPDGRHRRTLEGWVRSAVERADKIVALAPPDAQVLPTGDVRATTLGVDGRDPTEQLQDQRRRAVDEGFQGLGVVVWADNVIAATSVGFHADVEAALDDLCRDDGGSVLCLYGRTRADLLGMAVEQHPGGLHDVALTVRLHERTLLLAGEIDMDNLGVLDAALDTALDTALPAHLDLADVGFLSAAAAQHIGRYLADARAVESQARVHGARPGVRRTLRLSGVGV
jgi:anti-anti-sigma regulatory factor